MVFVDKSEVKLLYAKMHLFCVKLLTGQQVNEADFYSPGTRPAIFEWKGWKFGLAICYDIRFGELFTYYRKSNVDVILIPSAFLPETGKAHWLPLNQARAIETQSYVLSPAQAGIHQSRGGLAKRQTYGHSLAIDPWGQILWEATEPYPQTNLIWLKKTEIEKVRAQMPIRKHVNPFFN